MNIVSRAINILTKPKSEWPRIDAEPATPGGLLAGYALPLSLLPLAGSVLLVLAFASFIPYTGTALWLFVVGSAAIGLVLGLVVLFVMSLIADALAPNFGGVRNFIGALKMLVYAGTATWVAGFFTFIPVIGWLLPLLGLAYAAYLIYLGSMAVMKVPASSAATYTAAVIAIWFVLNLIVGFIVSMIVGVFLLGSAAVSGAGALMR
jgi:hypothetical protein